MLTPAYSAYCTNVILGLALTAKFKYISAVQNINKVAEVVWYPLSSVCLKKLSTDLNQIQELIN